MKHWFTILSGMVMAIATADAVQIKGTVTEVSGKTATVKVEGALAPASGDTVEIYFSLAGSEDEVSVAKGTVTKVDGDAVQITVQGATGEVEKGQLVRINSDNPQKRVAGSTATPTPSSTTAPATPADPNAGKDPAFAFVDMNQIFKDYPKTKSYEIKINGAKEAAKKEYDQRADTYKTALAEINELNRQLDSPKQDAAEKSKMQTDRDDKIAAIKKMEAEINAFRVEREKALQEQALQLRNELVSEITASINRLAGEKVELLFDRSGGSNNGVPVVVFSPRAAEMSARVSSALQGQSSADFEPTRGVMIGLIDMNRIFKYYSKTKESEAKINAAKEAAKKEYDKRAADYKILLDKINALNTQLTSASDEKTKARLGKDRDNKIVQIKKMEQEINDFRKSRETQLQADAIKMREGLVADINAALFRRLEAEQAPLIFDTSGNGVNGVAFVLSASGIPDLSDEIIAVLNKTSAKSGAVSLVPSTGLKFGHVDVKRAFNASPEGKQAETEINELKERAKAEVATADTATRDRKEKEIQDIAAKKRADILQKLTRSIGQVVIQEDLNFVFDSSGTSLNGVPFAVSVRNVPDLTDKVVAALKASP